MDNQTIGQHKLVGLAAPVAHQTTSPLAVFMPDGTPLLTYIQSLQTQLADALDRIETLESA